MSPETRQQLIALALGIVFIIGFIVFAQRLGQFLRGRQQKQPTVAEEITSAPEARISPSPTPSERRGFGILNVLNRLLGRKEAGREEEIEKALTPTPALAELLITPTPEVVQLGRGAVNGQPKIIPKTGLETSLLVAFISLFGAGMALRSRKLQ